MLLDAGADVNQTTEYGWPPLLAAVHNRHYRLAMRFLERGADPNIANEGGWTPLYLATDNRNIEAGDYPTRRPDLDHLELIAALLTRGADPNARMASSTETRTIFTHQWLYEPGATPFLRAAQSGDLTLLRLLLEQGADPSTATTNRTTPLMVASGIGWVEGVTYEWSREDTLDTVQLLIEVGADVNAVDDDGRTALHGTARRGAARRTRVVTTSCAFWSTTAPTSPRATTAAATASTRWPASPGRRSTTPTASSASGSSRPSRIPRPPRCCGS